MADSIEQLAEIVKDYARKNRRLNDRVADVETKLFGQSRDERAGAKKARQNTAALKNSFNAGLNTSTANKENSFHRRNKSPA